MIDPPTDNTYSLYLWVENHPTRYYGNEGSRSSSTYVRLLLSWAIQHAQPQPVGSARSWEPKRIAAFGTRRRADVRRGGTGRSKPEPSDWKVTGTEGRVGGVLDWSKPLVFWDRCG